jgi:hypothetical protein
MVKLEILHLSLGNHPSIPFSDKFEVVAVPLTSIKD